MTLVEETLGLGSDPRNDPDPQRIEKRLDLLRSHDHEPVGLAEIGGDLGDELVGTYAHRGGQPFLAHDLRLEPPGALDRGVEAAERRQVEIRFVDAGLLEGVASGGENRHDPRRDFPVERVIVTDKDRLGLVPTTRGLRQAPGREIGKAERMPYRRAA